MTYFTVVEIHSPCGTGKPMLFRLTYRREWRPEVQQWCDFKVAEERLTACPEQAGSL